nr:YfhJ family protein [Thalassobacillus sp. CUG 92003]
MEDIFDRLAKQLHAKNETLSAEEARTWVELLWEDFESTRAKAGRTYEGKDVTENIVMHWIEQYGAHLHHIASNYPKYKDKFKRES